MNKLTKQVASVALGTSILFTTVTNASASTYTVKSGDTLSGIAKKYGTTYTEIMKENNLKSTLILKGQTLQIGETTTSPSTAATSSTMYTVKSGDTLSGIAKKYGTTYTAIMKENNLTSTLIVKGQTLQISGATTSVSTTSTTSTTYTAATSSTTYTVKSGDTLSAIAKKYATTYTALMNLNGLKSTVLQIGQKLTVKGTASTTAIKSTAVASASTVIYTVKLGDTLSGIAKKHGTTYKAIMSLNGLNTTFINVGQKLEITNNSTSSKTTASTATASTAAVSTKTSTVVTSGTSAVSLAKKYIGVPYVFGGSSPSGFDCSGFIYYVFNNVGKSVSRLTAAGYYNIAEKVSTPQVGDLVFFSNTYKAGISHVGIYIGDGQMISASGSSVNIASITSGYWKSHFTSYGRI